MSGSRVMTEPCLGCGETGKLYHGLGRCQGCYSRMSRRADPARAERDRAASRAWKANNRERLRDYDRQYSQESKVPCQCGMLKEPETRMCSDCHRACAVVRRTLVEGMWADGWVCSQIAATLEITKTGVGVLMAKMREEGWDLPHRRTPEQVARIRAGWMRARQAA